MRMTKTDSTVICLLTVAFGSFFSFLFLILIHPPQLPYLPIFHVTLSADISTWPKPRYNYLPARGLGCPQLSFTTVWSGSGPLVHTTWQFFFMEGSSFQHHFPIAAWTSSIVTQNFSFLGSSLLGQSAAGDTVFDQRPDELDPKMRTFIKKGVHRALRIQPGSGPKIRWT